MLFVESGGATLNFVLTYFVMENCNSNSYSFKGENVNYLSYKKVRKTNQKENYRVRVKLYYEKTGSKTSDLIKNYTDIIFMI